MDININNNWQWGIIQRKKMYIVDHRGRNIYKMMVERGERNMEDDKYDGRKGKRNMENDKYDKKILTTSRK